MKAILLGAAALLLGVSAFLPAQAEALHCTEAKTQACLEASLQAEAYNAAAIKRPQNQIKDWAIADGGDFILKFTLQEEVDPQSPEGAKRLEHAEHLFSLPLQSMCDTPVLDKLIQAGGSYRTEVYDKRKKLVRVIPLECSSKQGGAVAS